MLYLLICPMVMPYNISMAERIRKSRTDLLHKIRYWQVSIEKLLFYLHYFIEKLFFRFDYAVSEDWVPY